MQKNKISILLALAIIGLVGCKSELDQKVSMDVSATAPDAQMDRDTLVVSVNQPVTFHISGNPDFITFFSGEEGHKYSLREEVEIPVKDIENSELQFTAMPQYGVIPNTLKVYLSTSYEGMFGKGNKKADSLRIESTKWIDISEECNLPTKSNGTSNVSISMMEYMGKNICVAFLYETDQNSQTQPTWEIQNIKLVTTTKAGTTTDLGAQFLGFNPFDMYAVDNAAYNETGAPGPGIWGIKNSTILRVSSSPAGAPINKDWMISKNLILNARKPDTGLGIKGMADNPLESYAHYYTTPGTYTVTFIGRNANFEHSSEVKRELFIKVL